MLKYLKSRLHQERGSSDAAFSGMIFCVVIALVMLVVGAFGVTYESVPPQSIGLHYTGGPLDGTKFVEVIPPGTGNKVYGLSEKIYKLPATQRTYSVKRDGSGDLGKADSISAPSKDNVPFTYEADVNFFLNQNPDIVKQFFEDVCLHNECWKLDNKVTDEKGWKQMLHARLRPQLENAIAQASKQFDSEALYNDPETLRKLNAQVSKNLSENVNDNLGGAFFCGVGSKSGKCSDFKVVISNPLPPQAVLDKLAATAAEVEGQRTAAAEAEKNLIAAQGAAESQIAKAKGEADAQRERAKSPVLSAEQIAYLNAQALLACAQNTNCTLVVGDTGGGVNINANQGG